MSLLRELKPNSGSTHSRKRVGRGIGSGLGGYSGKGGKGQTQRSGGSIRRGFEGGQTPLHRRLPKFGFSNVDFQKEFRIVNLDQISKMTGQIGPEQLIAAGFMKKTEKIKILGRGEGLSGIQLKAHAISDSARKLIEAAGGKVEIIK